MAAPNPCETFQMHLSADLDGSLPAELQAGLQSHLSTCVECAALRESLRVQTELVRAGMAARVKSDAVDFASFTARVMAQLPPLPPKPAPIPVWQRAQVALTTLWQTQRMGMLTGALAVALVAILVPRVVTQEHANSGATVQSVYVDPGAHLAPVVMASGTEDTIIWLVDHDDHLSLSDESVMPEWTDHPPLPASGPAAPTPPGPVLAPQTQPSGGDL